MGACLAGLGLLFWRLARWPRCSRCELALEQLTSTSLAGSPAVIETVYRCPRCAEVYEERVVGSWD